MAWKCKAQLLCGLLIRHFPISMEAIGTIRRNSASVSSWLCVDLHRIYSGYSVIDEFVPELSFSISEISIFRHWRWRLNLNDVKKTRNCFDTVLNVCSGFALQTNTLRGLIFAWINLREWLAVKNFAWIYFRAEIHNFFKSLTFDRM